jgi:hypothetical protein
MQAIQAKQTQNSLSMKKFVIREAESVKTTASRPYL